MAGPESKIEIKACEYATKHDILNRKMVYVGRRGAPDRIFLPEGDPIFFIEFKAPGGRFQPGQEVEIAKLRSRGYKVFVCDNLDYAKQIIDARGEL